MSIRDRSTKTSARVSASKCAPGNSPATALAIPVSPPDSTIGLRELGQAPAALIIIAHVLARRAAAQALAGVRPTSDGISQGRS